MKFYLSPAIAIGLFIANSNSPATAADNDGMPKPDRTVLPLKAPYQKPIKILDARNAKKPPLFKLKAPKDAPNVLIILIDDLSFAGTTAFGGVIPTPLFDKLAKNGRNEPPARKHE